jgi:pimeloyl-ACP methyl ester carboxylesterase
VLFAHGYVDPALPVELPSAGNVTGLRDALLTRGYGFAYSSYSENGFAVKDGVQRTRQLRGLFVDAFGAPAHTYITGQSLGGAVTLMLAETNPGLLDGAMPQCTFDGGSRREIEYLLNVRVLFDYFYPGLIRGDAVHVPSDIDFSSEVVPAVVSALAANPAKAMEMAGVEQIQIRYQSFPELVASVLNALFFQIRGTTDLLGRTHDRPPFDNSGTVYSGSSDDARLNGTVQRFTATPDALHYLEQYYEPDGRLRIPILTLHTMRDPIVPFSNEANYATLVESRGTSDLLVQRSINRFGHCAITVDEQVAALEQLVRWAEAGARPES